MPILKVWLISKEIKFNVLLRKSESSFIKKIQYLLWQYLRSLLTRPQDNTVPSTQVTEPPRPSNAADWHGRSFIPPHFPATRSYFAELQQQYLGPNTPTSPPYLTFATDENGFYGAQYGQGPSDMAMPTPDLDMAAGLSPVSISTAYSWQPHSHRSSSPATTTQVPAMPRPSDDVEIGTSPERLTVPS